MDQKGRGVGGMLHVFGSTTVAKEEAAKLLPFLERKSEAVGDCELAWVRSNVAGCLRLYIGHAPVLKRSYRLLGLLTSGAGLASAALAALSKSDSTRITIAVLGVIVGVVTQLLHIWRPAERSAAYYRARQALLREGWDYAQDAGSYATLQGDEARYQRFRAQVSAFEEAAAAYDEQAESAAGPASANGTPPRETEPKENAREEAG